MAAIVSNQSGLWSATSTWIGGVVPVSGDSVTIASGHVVTFDANQSAFASGIAGMVVTGTLKWITDGTVTSFKASGNISGAGSLYIGNSAGDPIPAPSGSTPEVATLAFNGAFGVTMTGTVEMHGELRAPAYAIASKTDNTHIVLSATLPLTWLRAGDAIAISDSTTIGAHSPSSETYTVSAYDAATGTITLSSSLSRTVNQNNAIDYVLLVSRNILHTSLATNAASYSGAGVVVSLNGVRLKGFSGNALSSTIASGASASYCTLDGCSGALIGQTVATTIQFCVAINSPNLTNSSSRAVVSDSYILNTASASGGLALLLGASNCSYTRCGALNTTGGLVAPTSSCPSLFIDVFSYNNTSGIQNSRSSKIINGVFKHNTTDAASVSNNEFFNCLFDDSTELTLGNQAAWQVTQSTDHDQVVGAFKAWCVGGNVTSVSSPVYDASRVRSYQHAPVDASNPVFMQRMVSVPPGASVNVRCYVQKDASMSYLPRLWVFSADKEPLISGSPDAEVIMTDSLNTWEVLTATVTNATDAPKQYVVRSLAKNATGNVYFDPIIRVSAIFYPALMQAGMVA